MIYHIVRIESEKNKEAESNVIIDTKSQIGGTLQDIESKVDSQPVNENIQPSLPPIHPNRKQGWCLVGTDRGNRSCLKVGVNDYCHSQHIYPSRDICIHPNLRM